MSTFEKISPDDPRLTAYALDEMEPAERAEFELLLQQDAGARAMVAEIGGTADTIGVALAGEPAPVFTSPSQQATESAAGQEYDRPERGTIKLLRFPQMYFAISGLAAACFAIGFIVWQANYLNQPQKHYTEIDLTKLVPADTANAKSANEAETGFEIGLHPASADADEGVVSLEYGGKDNAFMAVIGAPVSTFPINTGTAAYANVRHYIGSGHRPPTDAVRIEELVNYFPYRYAPSENMAVPFATHLEVASAPWAPEHRLVRIALKGREAKKLPATASGSAILLIAKAVKIRVEFNPAQVQAYRLIGYENRKPSAEDFSNDKIDAGDVVAGHTVTALYEIVPVSAEMPAETSVADELKYRQPTGPADEKQTELLTLTVGYKAPSNDVGDKLAFPLRDSGRSFDEASADFQFAASVAAFGMILRDSPHKGEATFASVTQWAQAGLVNDAGGYRAEFVGLVGQAERLMRN